MITPRRQKILLVEETNYSRLILSNILSGDGYKVSVAQNSGEAMHHISAELPDLILLAIRPNSSSGISTLRTLKDYFRLRMDVAQGADPAIIVLTSARDSREIVEARSLGILDILFKPLNMQELLGTVRGAITSKKKFVPQSRKKLMICGGEIRCQQFLQSILAHEMYDIESAESEVELMARVKHRRFDLSIIDLATLESEIADVFSQLRDMAAEMPIITIATSAEQVSQEELRQLGAQLHFMKPINIDVFRTEVDMILRESAEPEPAETGEEDSEDEVV